MYHKLIRITFLFFFSAILFAGTFGQNFTTVKTNDGVEILEKGKKVLFYQEQPKSLDGKYERAGYVHPLYSLHEKVLTQEFADDHPYHRGIFWAWHQVLLKGKKIADGWVSENISWQPVALQITKKENSVILQSSMLWKCLLENKKQIDIIKEHTIITVHRSTGKYRALDFDIHLQPLVDSVEIGGSDDEKGYGGFCLRLNLPSDVSFVSGNGAVTPTETPVTAGPWMDFRGSFDNEPSSKTSIAVFCRPPVPGKRQQWILRKEASMQNVPFPGRKPVLLTKKGWKLTYRIVIHDADMGNDQLEKLYQQYIHKL
ncbi:MAG: DUF6807 family protein [Ginsengibacter sp.]